jgi:putative tryptophan/tyrosine transport system substrate-binding protein
MRRIGLAVMLALGLALAPLVVEAQAISKSARVGVLIGGIAPAAVRESPYVVAFRDGLAQLGYREGQNLVLEVRSAERQTDLGGLAQELVQLKVDVIVAGGVASARSAKSATQTIPIVGVGVGGDPVAMGLARSFARPGGNFTGFLHGGTQIGKLLQLLQEALPGLTRAGAIWNPDNPIAKDQVEPWSAAARARGLSLRFIGATSIEELDAAFASLPTEKIRAAFVAADPLWLVQNRRAAEVALRHRIAAIWGHIEIAEGGGLMAYAPDIVDLFRQSAGYVKKILDGAKPGDLPLQYPSRWTLAVNLKTAKAIGVTLSPATLARADQIIE